MDFKVRRILSAVRLPISPHDRIIGAHDRNCTYTGNVLNVVPLLLGYTS